MKQCHGSGNERRAHFAEPRVEAEIERIRRLPFQEQPTEWGSLDKTIMTDYYPAISTGYPWTPAISHGSKIAGVSTDEVLNVPTLKDVYVTR